MLPIFLSLFTTQINAATILYFQDFSNYNSNDWVLKKNTCKYNGQPSQWYIENEKIGFKVNGGSCQSFNILNNTSLLGKTDYSIKTDITIKNSTLMDRNLIIKYEDNLNWYGIHIFGNTIFLEKVVNGVEYFLPNRQTLYNFQPNLEYKIEAKIINNSFEILINDHLVLDVTDSNPNFGNHFVGLAASAGSVTQSEVFFDNFTVTIPDEEIDVPLVKQGTLPWGNMQYDSASLWAGNNNTISRWGCAITSASMILNYYNRNITPDILNNWLLSQPDGYIGNGLVNWMAITRFAKETSDANSPKLEYKRYGFDSNILSSEIESNRPSIIKIQNPTTLATHFIVAKGKTDSDFLINDPGFEKTNLSQYSADEHNNINTFTPSNTDLSYMLFLTDINTNLELKDTLGNIIQLDESIEGPFLDPIENSPSNTSPLKMYLLSKPIIDTYTLKITSDGQDFPFFQSFLYDPEANLVIKKIDTIPGSINTLTISNNENLEIIQEISIDKIIQDLQTANQNGLVGPKAYKLINTELLIAKNLYQKNKLIAYKAALVVTIKTIQKTNNIDPTVAKILIDEIRSLLN